MKSGRSHLEENFCLTKDEVQRTNRHMKIFNTSHIISSVGKESACNAGDPGSIPGSGRSAGEGVDYPL